MKTIPQILLILLILAQAMGCAGAKPVSTQRIWNGSADTKWYSDSQNEFTITTPEQLAGLAKLVNNGNPFIGKTVKLGVTASYVKSNHFGVGGLVGYPYLLNYNKSLP